MKVLFTGPSGSLGKVYFNRYPDTVGISIRRDQPETFEHLKRELADADVLIHAAANVHAPTYEEAFQDNLYLSLEVLDAAKEANPQAQVILISSMSLLGRNGEIKPMEKMMPYTLSKYLMEQLSKKYDLPMTVARFSTLFYQDPAKDGLSKIITNAKANGQVGVVDVRRDFIPLEIAAEYLHGLCGKPEWIDQTVNIATGKHYSLVEIAQYLNEKYGTEYTVNETKGDDICFEFDQEPLNRIGYVPCELFEFVDSYYARV